MHNPSYDDRLAHQLSVAASVFATKGYHSTTMRDLARESGMSLSGMYYYVEGKDELLFTIQERCFREVIDGAVRAMQVARDPSESLERFITHHVTFFAQHMAEMKVLSQESESLSEAYREPINDLKRRYVELLVDTIEALQNDTGGVDPRIAAYALFGTMNWIYTWYDPEGQITPEALAEQFATIFLTGTINTAVAPAAQGG
ncbi:MAG: TetR/AcrR family transcriptional regulator [Gemmatimonadales bacterium]